MTFLSRIGMASPAMITAGIMTVFWLPLLRRRAVRRAGIGNNYTTNSLYTQYENRFGLPLTVFTYAGLVLWSTPISCAMFAQTQRVQVQREEGTASGARYRTDSGKVQADDRMADDSQTRGQSQTVSQGDTGVFWYNKGL
jgi:hypothetical protein